MSTQPIKAIPPPEHSGLIAPCQVWAHLNVNQQQQICQTLITTVNQLLTTIDITQTLGEMCDENNSNKQ